MRRRCAWAWATIWEVDGLKFVHGLTDHGLIGSWAYGLGALQGYTRRFLFICGFTDHGLIGCDPTVIL